MGVTRATRQIRGTRLTRTKRKRRRARTTRTRQGRYSRDHCPLICFSTTTEDLSSRKNSSVRYFSMRMLLLIDLSLTEVSKIIGDEWNKLNPEQKKVSWEPFEGPL